MTPQSHRELTNRLLPSVLAAGRLEMSYFKPGVAFETKADRSPVTEADRGAEDIIVASLARELPGVPVVAEEAFAAGQRPKLNETFLLVDALDGTKQFVSHQPHFTINIALVRSGVPIFGLIYAPALADFLVTDGAHAAWRARIEPSAMIESLEQAQPIAARVRSQPTAGITALQSRSRNLDISNEFLSSFIVAEKRQLGSSYKFCLIASGEAELYPQLGDTREWDTAAGHAILVAAGGVVTTLAGTTLVYGKAGLDYLNPQFVASSAPLSILRRAGATHPAN